MPAVNSRGRGRRTINEINMVPFIDVMLVLLIIFMVTAPLITPSMIAVPKIGKAALQPQQRVEIQISKDELIQVALTSGKGASSRPVSTTLTAVAADILKMEPAVKTANPGEQAVPVVISADKSIKYEIVVKVMDALQKAGVVRVGLSVQTSK
ncbi:biopolymer transporter ExbD [Polaromonas jejuensis]|uniref:Biopolymer transporter ExbD n=1 Tax=Polaromonas jejuensis TaxID=457502 RepID=A0ABW0QMQ5_9BURK|nr:biopolymer transporter ExbD [Polaromonas jejuensis]